MLKLIHSVFLSIFLISSLNITLEAGIIKKTAKTGVIYGATSATKKAATSTIKKSASKIFTKKKVNDRTAYQQNIDPSLKVKRETKKYGIIEETNLERMKNGSPPNIEKNGKVEPIELHHSRQNDKGSLFELSKTTHSIKNSEKGGKALHPYTPGKHPDNPVPKDRSDFNTEKSNYWKQRAKDFTDKDIK